MALLFHSVIFAVTGTPGTGKSTACALLKNVEVVHLNDLIRDNMEIFEVDEADGCVQVDTDKLQELVGKPEGTVVIEGHLSHLLENDLTIVLRCSPTVMADRLFSRDWPPDKLRENQEAEAVDVILVEAVERGGEVLEIDTTDMTPEEVAAAIESIIAGERAKYRPGDVDWSQEVLGWY
mgnify:CR=1 FL=1